MLNGLHLQYFSGFFLFVYTGTNFPFLSDDTPGGLGSASMATSCLAGNS